MNSLSNQVGQKIKTLRRILNLRQIDLADRAQITYRYYQEIESGRVNITLDTLSKVLAALGVDSKKFITMEIPHHSEIPIGVELQELVETSLELDQLRQSTDEAARLERILKLLSPYLTEFKEGNRRFLDKVNICFSESSTPDRFIRWTNKQNNLFMGADLVGRLADEVVPNQIDLRVSDQKIEGLRRRKTPRLYQELELTTKNKTPRFCAAVGHPVYDDNGRLKLLRTAVFDMSDLEESNRDWSHVQRLKTLNSARN